VRRNTLVAGDLAEEEVLRLNRGGAFVQAVDLGVADVLLDRVVLQKTRPVERLQGLGQASIRALGADAFDDRLQQVVDAGGQVGVGTRGQRRGRGILVRGRVEVASADLRRTPSASSARGARRGDE